MPGDASARPDNGAGRFMMEGVFKRDPQVTRDVLQDWFAARFGADRNITVNSVTATSGMSHEILIVDAAWTENGARRPGHFVIRVDPLRYRKRLQSNLRREFDTQAAINRLRPHIPVPKVYWYEADTSLLGAEFYAMERLGGAVAQDQPPYQTHGFIAEMSEKQRRTLWQNAVRAIAYVHLIPAEELGFLRRADDDRSDLRQHLDNWFAHYQWSMEGQDDPITAAAWRWLYDNFPTDCPTGLSWGDARYANLMFKGTDCVGVIDWEDVSLSSPLIDFGRWFLTQTVHDLGGLPRLPGLGGREETLELWEKLTGYSAARVRWFEVFSASCASGLIVQTQRLNAQHSVGPIGPRIINANAMHRILETLLQ